MKRSCAFLKTRPAATPTARDSFAGRSLRRAAAHYAHLEVLAPDPSFSGGITVLTDWRVRIVRRPDSKAPLRVTTWVRDSVPTGRIFRDYTLADESGTELVCAESRLVLFDLRAQKIIRIDQQRFRSYLPEARGVFASAAPRLRAPAAFDGEKTLPLRRSDIDFNGHVHNTKYLDFALEALPDTVPRDAFTGIRMVYPKAVKDVDAVTLKYRLSDGNPFVCVYSGDTLCTLILFET